jgi:hypothetical protein
VKRTGLAIVAALVVSVAGAGAAEAGNGPTVLNGGHCERGDLPEGWGYAGASLYDHPTQVNVGDVFFAPHQGPKRSENRTRGIFNHFDTLITCPK